MCKFSNDEFDSKLKSHFKSKSDLERRISLGLDYILYVYTKNYWDILNGYLVVTKSFGDYTYECSSRVFLSDEYSIYFVNDLGDKYYIALRNENKENKETGSNYYE